MAVLYICDSIGNIECFKKSEHGVQHKNQYESQNSTELNKETCLGIPFAAQYHRQGKTQDCDGGNAVCDLIDQFNMTFHNAEQHADNGDKTDIPFSFVNKNHREMKGY